jgi:hypothetical protein
MKSEREITVFIKKSVTGSYEYSSFQCPVSETWLDFREGTLDLGDHCIDLDDIAQIWVQNRLIWHDNAFDCPVCGKCADVEGYLNDIETKIKLNIQKRASQFMLSKEIRKFPFSPDETESGVFCNTEFPPCDEEPPKELDGFSLMDGILGTAIISYVLGILLYPFCLSFHNGPTETAWIYFAGMVCCLLLLYLIRQTIFRKIPLEQQVTQGECV